MGGGLQSLTAVPRVDAVRRYLSAAQVAELAELLEDAPVRTGMVDQVLQAAEERRGMTLRLQSPGRHTPTDAAARGDAPAARSRRGGV